MFRGEDAEPIKLDYDREVDIRPGAGIFSRPFFWGGKAYFGSLDKKIYCLDSKTGDPVWNYVTNGLISALPVVQDGILFITSWDGCCYALDAETGELLWRFMTGGRCLSSPAVVDGNVFFGSNDKHFYCIDSDGNLVWKFISGDINNGGAAVVNGRVIFVSYDNNFYCLDKNSGNLIWKFRTGGHTTAVFPTVVDDKFNEIWGLDKRLEEGKAEKGIIFAGSSDRHLYAVTLDGRLYWKFLTGSWPATSACVFRKNAYFSSYDMHIYCVDAETGVFRWRYITGKGSESTPLIHNNTLYVGSMDTNLYALGLDGSFKWRFKTNGGVNCSPAINDNKLYVGSFDGKLYCLSLEGELIWDFQTGFGEPAVLSDSTQKILERLEKTKIISFFKPETIQRTESGQLAKAFYSVKTDPAFLQESAGLYKSQPTYRTMTPYTQGQKKGYESK